MKKHLPWLIIVILLIVGWVTAEYVGVRRADPAGRAGTLSEFLAWRPAAERFAFTEVAGQRYILAYGPGGGLLPAGPAAYVFDPDGKLVDWSRDIGDRPTFDTRWDAQRAIGARPLSRDEVTELMTTPPAE